MKDADWHWFRYPYLREGETLEKRHAVATLLKDRGYRVAQVTLNFDDYAYNDPYTRCMGEERRSGDRRAEGELSAPGRSLDRRGPGRRRGSSTAATSPT